jgi:hypothetical protein
MCLVLQSQEAKTHLVKMGFETKGSTMPHVRRGRFHSGAITPLRNMIHP